jgi:MFS family permease
MFEAGRDTILDMSCFILGLGGAILLTPILASVLVLFPKRRQSVTSLQAGIALGWLFYGGVFIILGVVIWQNSTTAVANYVCSFTGSSDQVDTCKSYFVNMAQSGQVFFFCGVLCVIVGVPFSRRVWLDLNTCSMDKRESNTTIRVTSEKGKSTLHAQ